MKVQLPKSMIKLLSLADIISLTNALFGFLAIVMAFQGEMRYSFSLILLALLADGLDGLIARKNKQSKIGGYLESMADMTSLGIAPSVFIYISYYDVISCCIYHHIYLIVALIAFLALGIVRLASFHLMKEDKFFVGLPASVSTILLLVMAFTDVEFYYIPPVILIVSILMVSNLRFPKTDLKINIVAAVLILINILLGRNYYAIAPLFLIIAVLAYAIVGPIYLLKSK